MLLMQPLPTFAQDDFLSWMVEASERQADVFDAIDFYVKVGVVPGLEVKRLDDSVGPCTFKVCQAIKVDKFTDSDGRPTVVKTPLSPEQVGVLAGSTSSAFVGAMGRGLLAAQFSLNRAMGGGATDISGLNKNIDDELYKHGNSDYRLPLLLNPSLMFGLGGEMFIEAAKAIKNAETSLQNSTTTAKAEANQTINLAKQLKHDGSENVAGILANAFRNTGPIGMPFEDVDGQSFKLNNLEILVDPKTDTIVKHRMEGTTSADGESRDFYLEVVYSDFRNPPGCGEMYEPYKRVMRMGGVLDDKQMAQMEEARVQLAQFEQQLASMPAQQRAMMEKMMGSQLEMMRGLVNSGGIEFVEQTEQVLCNPDFASLFSVGGAPEQSDQDLIREIQEYLVILGYEPGNVDGVLDTMTMIAISQFQAEAGLPVTGEPSFQLAALLAERVGA